MPAPRVNGELILEAARAGMGVVLANSTIAREDLRSGRLVRPIEETMDTRGGLYDFDPQASRTVEAKRVPSTLGCWVKSPVPSASPYPPVLLATLQQFRGEDVA